MSENQHSLLLGEIKGKVDSLIAMVTTRFDDQEKRIRALEKWKWWVAGALFAWASVGPKVFGGLVKALGGSP